MPILSKNNDWRVKLFGNFIQTNQAGLEASSDEEAPITYELVPTTTALDSNSYDYVAVFMGAEYCPHW